MDAVYRDLEREVLRSPGDAGLRDRLRQARRRIFGFDWEDPVIATARDVCTTTSLAFVDVPSLDVAREIAKRPPQGWLVQFSAEVQPQAMLTPASALNFSEYGLPPFFGAVVFVAGPLHDRLATNHVIVRDEKDTVTGRTRVMFESRGVRWQRNTEWSTVTICFQLTSDMTFVAFRWRTTHGTVSIRTRSVVATPICPVSPMRSGESHDS